MSDPDLEHLFIRDLRRHPDGEVRLYSQEGRLISGTRPSQVIASIDAMTIIARNRVPNYPPSEDL